MTGEVAFSEVTFREALVFWNSTQFSTHKPQGRERKKEKLHQSTLCMAKENKTKIRCLVGPGLESCEAHIFSGAEAALHAAACLAAYTPTGDSLPLVYRFSLKCGPAELQKRLCVLGVSKCMLSLGNCPRQSPSLGGMVRMSFRRAT